ncbi:MAG: CARDB domain-containing protein [Chitinophagales bacterium]
MAALDITKVMLCRRRSLKLLTLVVLALTLLAPYAKAQTVLNAAEYFIDTDPGVGNGTPLSFTSGTDSVLFTTNVTVPGATAGGLHYLFVRTRTTGVKWSVSEGRPFFVNTNKNINYAEYFFDTDPGVGNATAWAITPGLDSTTFTGNISVPGNISGGLHYLFIRTRTVTGLWSMSEAKPVYINSGKTIAYAEYFFDTDPGVGNATSLAISSGIDSTTHTGVIPVPLNLSGGIHYLYVRTRTTSGLWSHYEGRPLFINSGKTIDAAEYFFDTDPGIGHGFNLPISSGIDSTSTTGGINIPGTLNAGNHFLYVRTRSSSGLWSLYEGRKFTVKPQIVAAEYFIDIDPGVGNGFALPVTPGVDSVSLTTNLVMNCVDSGNHYLFVRTRNNNGNWSLYEPQPFSVNVPAPQISALGSNTICTGDSVKFTVNTGAGCNYQWFRNNAPISGATGQTLTAFLGGAYKVQMTVSGTNYLSNIINVTVGGSGQPPSISFTPDTTVCSGTSITLTAMPNGAQSYTWSTGATTQAINFTAVSSGYYYVTVTDTTGCNAEANIHINVNALPVADAHVTGLSCQNGNIQLNGAGGVSYSWSGPAYTGNTQNPVLANAALAASGIYTLTVTDANSCQATDTAQLTVHALPVVTASNGGPYCGGQTISLTSGGAATYSWSGASSFNSNIQNPTRSNAIAAYGGNYTVTGTDINGCANTASTTVTVNVVTPLITPNGPTTFCSGGSVDLTASGGSSYVWSNSSTNATITVSASGTYTVTVTSGSCTASTSQSVVVNTNPVATAGHSTPTCQGTVVTLSSTGGTSYSWSGPNGFNSTQQNPLLSNNATTALDGTYNVTVTNTAGCSSTANAVITINPNPLATATNTGPYCSGANLQLNGGGGTGYSWSGPNSFSSILQNPVINNAQTLNAGLYTVTVTNSFGCNNTASTTVTVNTATATITPAGPTTFCAGSNVLLTANAGSSYLWSTGATTQSITASATNSYSVTVTAANSCTASASQAVTVNPLPTVSASNTGPYCIGYTIQLNAGGTNINSYNWSGPNSFSANIQNPSRTNSVSGDFGTYTITVSSSASCTATATTTVNSNGTAPVLSFSGNSGFTAAVVNPAQAGPAATFRFEVKYTDANGDLPQTGYPRVLLDYENDNNFTGANDHLYFMQEADASDVNVTDGKIYYVTATGLTVGTNYHTTIQANDNSATHCTASFGSFDAPDVLADADISIFANDITFSVQHPDTSSALQVCAVVHNNSDFPASNFTVHLRNQYDTLAVYPDVTVPFLAAHSQTTVCWNIITPSTPSWNPMQVFIDYSNIINEPNELDNQAIRPFVNGNFILPGKIQITANVNPLNSYAVANNWLTVCGHAQYVNTAVQLQNPSTAGATVTITVPSTGATYSGYTNSNGDYCISFLAPVTPGLYNVQAHITDYTLDGDTTAPFVLLTPPCVPDLTINNLNVSSTTILEGQSITANYTVSNVGCGNVLVSTVANWSTNGGTPSGSSTAISPLNSGQSQFVNMGTINFPTQGSYNICASADVNNQVVESNENNTQCVTIHVLPAWINLVPSVYSFSIQSPCSSSSFYYRVYNTGGITAPAGSQVRLEIYNPSNVLEATLTQTIGSVSPQGYVDVTMNHQFLQTGNYNLHFYVDYTNAIAEHDEGDNDIVNGAGIPSCPVYQPDLVVAGCGAFQVSPVNPLSSGTIDVSATIVNNGSLATSAPFVVDFFVGGVHYTSTYTGTLASGASAIVTKTVPTPSPSGNLVVTADNTNTVVESNEGNNNNSTSLCHEFSLGADCYGQGFWSYNHVIGVPFKFGVSLYNNGDYKASDVTVKYEVSGPGLPAGFNYWGDGHTTNVGRTCSCPYGNSLNNLFAPPSVGTYTVRMTVDPNNDYTECNESNNVFIVTFVVTNLPDYRVLSQYIAPSLLNPEPNQPITVDVTYENVGLSNVVDSLNVRLIADNSVVATVRAPGLVNGGYNTVHVPSSWSSSIVGVHILRAIVDASSEITESNESNNEATRAIIVGQNPNLHFTQIQPSDSTPTLGQNISFTVTVANDGDTTGVTDLSFAYVDNNGDTIQIYSLNGYNVPHNGSSTFTFNWTVLDPNTYIFGYIKNTNPIEYLYDDNYAYVELGALKFNFTVTPESCIGDSNGVLTLHVTDGLPPYIYVWSNGGSDSTITGTTGNYSVTVYDNAGNTGIAAATIGSIPDNTAPLIFNVPSNINYVASNGVCPAIITWTAPSASDNCSVDTLYSNHHSGDAFAPGTTTVTYTAKDKAGNTQTASFTVTVVGSPLAFAGNDKVSCLTDTLEAQTAQFGTGTWSVLQGGATFANANNAHTSFTSTAQGVNKFVWTITNGTCPTVRDTVSITNNATLYFADADNDSYGDALHDTLLCAPQAGYVLNNTDCNDNNASIHPGAAEICGNGIDEDCNGADVACGVNTWTGAINNDWSLAGNWSIGVPVGCQDVVIPNTANDPVVTAPVTAGNVQLSAGASITLDANLTVCGNWVGGIGVPSQVIGNAELVLNGTSLQTLSGRTEFNSIRLNNAAGAALQAGSVFDVFTELDLQNGIFTTSGATLRFRSTSSTQIAIIDNFSSGYTGTIVGPVSAQRYYDAAAYQDAHYFGSPVAGTIAGNLGSANSSGGFVTATANCDETTLGSGSLYGNVYSYDESNGASCNVGGWKVEAASSPLSAGKGYSVRKVGAGTLTLSGAPNLASSYTQNGTNGGWANVSLQGRPTLAGWTMVSNPYLATLDLSTAAVPAGYDAQYAVWNATGPFAGTYTSETVIAPFQAFFVRRSSAGGPMPFTINASNRTKNPQQFQALNNSETVTLYVTNTANGLKDKTTVGFSADATTQFDSQLDGVKLSGALNRHTLYSYNNDPLQWYSKNMNTSIAQTGTVNVGFEPGITGTYNMSFDGLQSFDPTSYITLEDKKLNVFHDVRSGDYSFTAAANDNWNRFVLHFTPKAEFATVNSSCNADGQITVTQAGTANWNYSITDDQNVVVMNGVLNQSNPVTVSAAPGVYTVTLTDNNNYVVIKNIQVNGSAGIVASMSSSATVAQEGEDIVFTSTTVNAATTEWNLGDGTSSQLASIVHQYANAGTYPVTLTVTNADGCSSWQQQTIEVNAKQATDVNEVGPAHIKMWSNANRVFVDFSKMKLVNATVTIYNLLGQELSSEQFNKASVYSRLVEQVDAGYILLTVKTEQGVVTKKLLITNQ